MAREQSLAKSIKEKIIKALTESHYPMYHDVSIFQSKTVYIYIYNNTYFNSKRML